MRVSKNYGLFLGEKDGGGSCFQDYPLLGYVRGPLFMRVHGRALCKPPSQAEAETESDESYRGPP